MSAAGPKRAASGARSPGTAGVPPASPTLHSPASGGGAETPALRGGGEDRALAPRSAAIRSAAPNPAQKPRRLASEDLPARIADSKADAGIGSRPDAAMAPSITELIIARAAVATASMSNSRRDPAFLSTTPISFAVS